MRIGPRPPAGSYYSKAPYGLASPAPRLAVLYVEALLVGDEFAVFEVTPQEP